MKEWVCHFENVAALNGWDDYKKTSLVEGYINGTGTKGLPKTI